MAEHSMCHPGLPGPTSVSQNGSPSLGAFQTAKSRGLSFSYSSESMRAWPAAAAGSTRDSRPYAGKVEILKYRDPRLS